MRDVSRVLAFDENGRVGEDATRDALPPRHTGRAVFPHPAFPSSFRPQAHGEHS